jgi:site-specific recombinase XerD
MISPVDDPHVAAPDPGTLHRASYGALAAATHHHVDPATTRSDDWVLAQQVLDAWVLGHSRLTAQAYRSDVRDFFTFCRGLDVPPLGCTRAQLDLYARHLAGPRGLAASTVARRLTALAGFYGWACEEELLMKSPMARVRRPRPTRALPAVTLDRDDLAALLREATAHSPRAAVLVHLLVLNALRVSEVCGSDVSGLGAERGHRTLTVLRKGAIVARIPLAPPTAAALDNYLAERCDGPLLLSRTGRRLDRSNAARLLTVIGTTALSPQKAAGLHPHACRHGAITAMLDAGAPLRDVQDAAGHASASQTRAYDDARFALERNPTYALSNWLGLA